MFDATQYATLRTLVDRMIPADDAPGGLAAGVDRYILHLLQHDGRGYSIQYEAALTAVQRESMARYATPFAQLTTAQADNLLQALAQNDTRVVWAYDAKSFIEMLAEHCAEGFYADPRQGGNDGAVSWRMLGFEERR